MKIIPKAHKNRSERNKILSKAIRYGETNLHNTNQNETGQILLWQYLFEAGENWREALGWGRRSRLVRLSGFSF